ncbi:DUF262 domain-containing protein [Methylobacterium tarhaniae]|uniref:DUF262 domain-containing protein n=1 Tax=Methylobacterium tarhaniae TaxID=1187852 RepID=UPI0009FA080A|nr:DUF262 domain-containing protein [Methylobacterium tarhaniae]
MSLQEEIEARRRLIKTDSYSMSIGELMSIYQNNELDLHPEFQRFFRWSLPQKTKLIESIMLGIPLPPVFVSQRQDGVWDVIDGLQRLSTIFQFAGILLDNDGNKVERLKLSKAKYLPSLENKIWESKGDDKDDDCLTQQQRIDIRRSKIDVNIIQRESNKDTKYDMFERLNTGGTPLSEQEVRNCLLIMTNREFYKSFESLANNPDFQESVTLTDRAREERYDMELITRFIVLRHSEIGALAARDDVNTFITEKLVDLASGDFDFAVETARFEKTFRIINSALADNAFKKYVVEKSRYSGGFLVSVFEMIAIGLGQNVDAWADEVRAQERVKEVSKIIWHDVRFTSHQGSGVRGSSRIPHTIPLGAELFAA